MHKVNATKTSTERRITLAGRMIDYRVVGTAAGRRLRVRVGLDGVEVVQPAHRPLGEVKPFLLAHQHWIISQLERVERLRVARRPQRLGGNVILYRGVPTPVWVEDIARRERGNQVVLNGAGIVVIRGRTSQISPAKSLENWLRRQVRAAIGAELETLTRRLNHAPCKVYVMGQRTKWGNCSVSQNLSFNWRLILAPPPVLEYLVTHEAVHLAIPDHSRCFWLTVQSLCPQAERARQWLSANAHDILVDLELICPA